MGLLLIAATYLTFNVTRPLKDYDEATYAKVIVDTFKSGDVSTFTLSGHTWFEKPSLYIWEAMGAVKIFGDGGFAFRLPSIIASTLCIWLVYLITKRLTGNDLAALSASLVVLTVAPFYVFAIEMRMDSSVIMGMLAALYFFIRGWIDERYLLAVAPAIAIGFMFKSVIVFLIGPILLLYAIFYSEWRWIRSRYLWLGTLIALGIWLPWHALETLRFGSTFWNEYLGHQILQRASSTLTGTNSYTDIPRWLFVDASYWSFIVVGLIGLSAILSIWKKTNDIVNWKHILPPIISALFIFLVFTMVRTHLPTYMMPAFPFLAMFIGIFLSQLSALFRRYSYVASIVIFPLITAPLVVIGAASIGIEEGRGLVPELAEPDCIRLGQPA